MDMKLNGYSVYEMQRSAISILNDYFNGFKKYLVDSSYYSYDFLFYKLQELSVLLDSFYAVHLLSDDELSFYSNWRHSYYRTLESLSWRTCEKFGVLNSQNDFWFFYLSWSEVFLCLHLSLSFSALFCLFFLVFQFLMICFFLVMLFMFCCPALCSCLFCSLLWLILLIIDICM